MNRKDILILIESLVKNNPNKKVQIELLNRKFYIGKIVNYENEECISFIDNKLGYINILYSQILDVEPLIEK